MQKNSAQSLILVVFVITAFAAITVTLAAVGVKELEIREIEERSLKTYYISDAGYERGRYYLHKAVKRLPNLAYRRRIRVDNTAGPTTLIDYPILVTLDTASLIGDGKMRDDCGDMRFTDYNGITMIDYWIESGCNTNSTQVWVIVPTVPANSEKSFYFYYGNPNLLSESNSDICPAGIIGGYCSEYYDDFNDQVASTPCNLDTRLWGVIEEDFDGELGLDCVISCDTTSSPGELHISSQSRDTVDDLTCPGPCGYSFMTKSQIDAYQFLVLIRGRYVSLDYKIGSGKLLSPFVQDLNKDLWGLGFMLREPYALGITEYINNVPDEKNIPDRQDLNNSFEYIKIGDNIDFRTWGTRNYDPAAFTSSLLETPFKMNLYNNAGACWGAGDNDISFDAYWDSIYIRKYANPEPGSPVIDEEVTVSVTLSDQVIIGPDYPNCPDSFLCQDDCNCDQNATNQYYFNVRITPHGKLIYDRPDDGRFANDSCVCDPPEKYCCCPGVGNFCIDSSGRTPD